MDDFTGCWVLDKSLSDSADPLLKAFGVSYVLRSVILRLRTVTTFRYEGDKLSVVQTTSGKDKVDEFVLDGEERPVTGEDGVQSRVTASTDGVRVQIRTMVPKLSLAIVSERSLGEDSHQLHEHVLIQGEGKKEERLHFTLRRNEEEEASRGLQEAVAAAIARHQRLRAAAAAERTEPEPAQHAAGADSREDRTDASELALHSRERTRRHRRRRPERSRRPNRSDRHRHRKPRSPSSHAAARAPVRQESAPQGSAAAGAGAEGESLWAPAVDALAAALRWVRDEPPQLLAALVVSGMAGSLYGASAVGALVLALAATAYLDGALRGRPPGASRTQPLRAQAVGPVGAGCDAAGRGRASRDGAAGDAVRGSDSSSGSGSGSGSDTRSGGGSDSGDDGRRSVGSSGGEEGAGSDWVEHGPMLPLRAAESLPRVPGAGADCNLRYCPDRGALLDAGAVSCLDITAFLKIPPVGPPLAAPYVVPGERVRAATAVAGTHRRRHSRDGRASGGVARAGSPPRSLGPPAASTPPESLASLWEVVDGSSVGASADGSPFGGDDGAATVLTGRGEGRPRPVSLPATPQPHGTGAAQLRTAPDGGGRRVAPPLCLHVRGIPHVFYCDAGGDVHVVWPGAAPSASAGGSEEGEGGREGPPRGSGRGGGGPPPLPAWSRDGWGHRLLRGEIPALPRCVDGLLSGVVEGGRPHLFFRTPCGGVREVVFMAAGWHCFDLHAAAARRTPQPPLAGALGEAFRLGVYFRDVEERPFTLSYSLLRGWRCLPVDERGEARRAASSPRADVVVGKLPRGRGPAS